MSKRESKFSLQSCNSSAHQTPPYIMDPGKIRLDGIGPSFGPVQITPGEIRDSRKVRLGGIGPAI
jgi:hypothetical protein